MSLYGSWLPATIDAGKTDSDEIDLGRDYDFLEVQIPELESCTLKLQTAEKSGGDFNDLGYNVTTTTGTHDYHDVWELGGWQFIKVVASASQGSTNRLIRVRGMRY